MDTWEGRSGTSALRAWLQGLGAYHKRVLDSSGLAIDRLGNLDLKAFSVLEARISLRLKLGVMDWQS